MNKTDLKQPDEASSQQPLDREEKIQAKAAEYRRAGQEHQRVHAGDHSFGIDPGEDPISEEAALRVIEESLVETLSRHPGISFNLAEVAGLKSELRKAIQNRSASHPPQDTA